MSRDPWKLKVFALADGAVAARGDNGDRQILDREKVRLASSKVAQVSDVDRRGAAGEEEAGQGEG